MLGEAQIRESIASKMDAALLFQWDGGVLEMGLSRERSIGALLGSTKVGDFGACLTLHQRFNETPVFSVSGYKSMSAG